MAFDIRVLDRMCLILVVCVFLVSSYWTGSQIITHRRQVRWENTRLSKTLQDITLAEHNLHRLNAALAATKKEIHTLKKRIPESPHIGEFLREVDTLVKKRGIVLESLQPLTAVTEEYYFKIPIRMIGQGPFVNVYRLLYDLETMDRLNRMESLIISNPNADRECHFDLTTTIFEQKE